MKMRTAKMKFKQFEIKRLSVAIWTAMILAVVGLTLFYAMGFMKMLA